MAYGDLALKALSGNVYIKHPHMTSICLNMIVRDEAAVIERCLASVRPFIDYWVIVDTGSQDDTPARITAALAGLPGELHHRPWRNFAHNRNEALQLAKGRGDYLLFIDADETLVATPGFLWPALTEPAYSLAAHFGEMDYDRVSLVATSLPWRWQGVLHEYLDAGQPVAQPRLPGLSIHVRAEGARSRDPDKYLKDAAVLEAALREEPDNARYQFYLAQSYRDAGQPELALQHYRRRAAMAGWDEENWFAHYQCALLMASLQYPAEQVVDAYLAAWELRPSRCEPLLALACYYRLQQQWQRAWLFASAAQNIPQPADRLFVDLAAYGWRGKDELALAAFYTGRIDLARQLWQALLAGAALPDSECSRVERNLAYTKP